ncbi:phosphate signaling complex protein PhoU [Mycolicibacterium komossense]|uniref:Phosphate-specific transport system accessory protein PhoU n=1 Tax=Mycolicibacterium komossense TaxID=1779 RepID=A0ABT3CMR0_9MYCO|nr:phosphate signaling complex protein PhoU [Mycolicibacterium komossense]MCV7230796.1 phosphate signaling complex protein PhoU [Mycolicibacterium komossense]
MRTAYQNELSALLAQVGDMCGLAGVSMERATRALLGPDLTLAEEVITDHEAIVEMGVATEERALVLLARQAPVAGDLRTVVSSMKNAADVDRMAALALHVATIARRRHPRCAVPDDVAPYFTEMGRIAVDLGNSARDVVVSRDPRKAAQIRHDDDAIDELHSHLFTVLKDQEWRHGVAAGVDVALLSRYYERFADHAVELARRVIYQATGSVA